MKRMFVLLALVGVISIAQFSAPAQAAPYDAYLMAHFIGEGTNGEQIYFALSTDGLHWTDVNDSQRVLTVPADLGDGGVRDPSLIRSADGTKFWILATDLCIGCGTSWGDAQTNGSTSLVIWESTDLINWSEPWLIDVASSIPNAGCAWAPEAIYDEANANYVIYWATIDTTNWKQTVYYVTTTDFVNVSAPQVYIQRPGSESIIDTQIIEVTDPSSPYQYYRASRDDGNITIEASDLILDTSWAYIGNINSLGVVASEGPMLYKFNDANEWCMMVDQYSIGAGYLPIVSTDLSDMGTYSVLSSSEYDLGVSLKRHGSVLNITTAEYDAILANDWSLPIPPTPPLSGEDISSFFVNLDFDSGDVTTPGPFTGFDTPVDIAGWQDYPSSPLNDAGVEGPGAWWGPYQINAGFMSTGDGAYNISTYPIESNDIFRIGFQAQWWDWTGAAGEWTATLFYDDPANVIGTFVQSGLTSSWTAYSDATFIPATPASVGGTLGILLQSTGGGIAQIDEITIERVLIQPVAPTSLTAVSGIGSITLDWDDNVESDLDSYNVYRSATQGDPSTYPFIQNVIASQYVDNTVNNGTKYYYVVTAENTSAIESGYSNEDSALPPDLTDDNKIDFEDFVEVGNAWLTTYDMNALKAIAESWLLGI